MQLLGLSPNEAKIYEALVEKGESSISDIAAFAGVHRRNVYDSIQRLIEKGLCFEIFSKAENHYCAVDPGKLSELVAEKQQKLSAIMPDLQKKFHQQMNLEEAYIYRGYEGLKNIWRDMVRVGKPIHTIGARGQWFDKRLVADKEAFFKEANRKKLMFYNLFDFNMKEARPDIVEHFGAKLEYHFLPKAYNTNSTINIFGDYVVTYTGVVLGQMNENTTFFVLRSKDLAESYRTWFWYMWEQSEEPKGHVSRNTQHVTKVP